ncbi:hypothetical protein VTK26DRAFT_6499 [Humicola hyalothermophila]
MATSTAEAKDGKAFYAYLFANAKPIPTPTPILDALLRAIALHIANEIGDKNEKYLTPAKLAAFYKAAGHNFDSFFVEMPHVSISIVYRGLGCQHLLLPDTDDFAPPSIPALTVKGFVRWQAIQTLLGPQTQVPVLQFAVANWALKHPDTDTPFPVDLPREAFPSETDPDTDRWHQECANRSRMESTEDPPDSAHQEEIKPEFTERKVPYTHVRVSPTTPRDYFAARPVNVAYVHVGSPRPTPPARSPERERERDRERYARRQASSDELHHRRRSFSDYPHSPHETLHARSPHFAPEHSSQPRRHSQPRHYSSTSESDGTPISPRASRRPMRSNEPPPISIRRVYTGSAENSPRVIRTTMPPPPIPTAHTHSPRHSEGGRSTPRGDDSRRHSALFDLKEIISNFINTGVGASGDRARSVSGSRARRDGFGGPVRGMREDVLPSSRLSRSWSDIGTDDTDSEDEPRRRSRRHSRERERDRERALRERDRDRDRERDRPRLRERYHSDRESDRDRRDRDRDWDRDRDRDRLTPSAAAAAASATLNRDVRRRAGSDEELSPRRKPHGPYLSSMPDGHRRTSSHADIDRRRDREWDRDRERDLRDRERNRGRDHEYDRERLKEGGDYRWRRDERLSRERDRERDRGRDRERMPSPAISGGTGVGGRKYPDVTWQRD